MTGKTGFWDLLRSDIAAWEALWRGQGHTSAVGRSRRMRGLRLLWLYPGLRATILYRLSHSLRLRRVPVAPQFIHRLNLGLYGLDIPPTVPIGPRLYIPHPVGTVVMAARIGSGTTLVSNVTIGMRNELAFPTIGNDVYVGAGARVLGKIRVGSNVKIGANAVVLHDVPDNSVAVGVPARIRPVKRSDYEIAAE